MAKKYVAPTYERIEKTDSKGHFFVRLAYGVVGSYKDTSSMTTTEVIEEFLDRNGVKTPREFFEKKFKGKKNPEQQKKDVEQPNKSEEPKQEAKQEESNTKDNPREIKSNVPKAKTTKEAEQIAREMLGIEADYNKMDIDVANALNEQISKVFQFCPDVKQTLLMTGSGQARNKKMQKELEEWYIKEYKRIIPGYNEEKYQKWAKSQASKDMAKSRKVVKGAYAISSRQYGEFEKYSGIFINDEYGRNAALFNESKENSVKTGHSPIGSGSYYGTINHELGHQLMYALDLDTNPEIIKLWNETQETGAQGLSNYSRKNIKEFIAEGWSEFMGNPEPRPIAQKIGEIVIKANKGEA